MHDQINSDVPLSDEGTEGVALPAPAPQVDLQAQLAEDLSAAESGPNAPIFGSPQFVSQGQRDAALRMAEENEIGLGEAIGLAWERDSIEMGLHRALTDPRFPADDDFRLDLPTLKGLVKDVPAEEHGALANNLKFAQSMDHARWMVEQYKVQLGQEEKLAGKGWVGVGVRLGVGVLDPAALAISAGTSPLVVAATRLRRAIKTGLIAGVENAAIERFLESTSQINNPYGALYAFFGGVVLGGGLGALGKNLNVAERKALLNTARSVMDSVEAKTLRDAGIEVPAPPRAAGTDPVAVKLREDVDEAEVGGKAAAETPTIARVVEEDAEEALAGFKARSKELADQAAALSRQLDQKAAALNVLRAMARAGDVEELGGGVSVRRVPKEAKQENLDKLPPEVRALIDAHTTESGAVNRKMLRELERDIEVLTKEAKALTTKSTALRKIADLRAAKAAVKKATADLEAGVDGADKSVGAAMVQFDNLRAEFSKEGDLDSALLTEILNAPYTAFSGARFDIMAKLKSNRNPWVRWIGGRMAEDPVANKNNEVLEIGASEIRSHLLYVMETKFYQQANPTFDGWAVERGLNPLERIQRRREFFEEVGIAVREGGSADKHVQRAAKAMQDVMADFVIRAKQVRLAGFLDAEVNPNYLPRLHASDQVRRFDTIYGTGQVAKQLIQKAIKNEQPNIEDDIAEKLAVGYWNRVRKIAAGQTIADLHTNGISLDNRDLVFEILEDAGIGSKEIDDIMLRLENLGKTEGGKVSRGKSRLLLDENTEVQLKQGPFSPEKPYQVDTVRFSDLLENNAERLFRSYSRQMSGYIALAEKFKAFVEPDEGFNRATFDRVLRHAERWAGDNGVTKEELTQDIDDLNFLWKAVTGAPLEADPLSVWSTAAQRIRGYNFVRVMNQVGFAQIPEFANALHIGGFRNVVQHLPELKATLTRAASGHLEDEYARELEELFGLGTEYLRHATVSRWDDMDYRVKASSKLGQNVDLALDAGRRFTSVISGLVPINTIMQRSTMKAIGQKFVNMANGVEKINEKRMRSLGLSDDMLKRVLKEVKNATVKDGKVLRLNVEKWTDKEALNAFTYASFRLARRIVQENDIGGMHRWMSTGLAKVLFQFRGFMLQAWTKQLLYNIKMNDMQGYMSWATASVFGALAYMAQTHFNAIGRGDREEFLEKRLAVDRIAAAAFQRVGASSLLPVVGDSIWWLGSDDPLFQGRTTGLPSDAFLGNPTTDLVKQTFLTLKGAVRAPLSDDYDYSKRDFRALWSILFLQNAIGVTQVGNLLQQDLPDYSN